MTRDDREREELFNRWNDICAQIQSLGGVVQNDMKLNFSDINEWSEKYAHLISELDRVKYDTRAYLIKKFKERQGNK